MLTQPIAILGGGHSGHCMAADLTLGGYKVSFYEHPQFESTFKTTLEAGAIELITVSAQRQAKIHKVTMDMEEALSDARLIILALPATGHELFFNTMIPYLKDDQVVVLMPGNFGAFRLRKLLNEKTPGRKIIIYETHTAAYTTRLTGQAKVHMMSGDGPSTKPEDMPQQRLLFGAALPAKDSAKVIKDLQKLFHRLLPAQDVLAVSLGNSGHVNHPAGVLPNAGRIEYSKGDFYLWKEGMTPSVLNLRKALIDEVVEVGDAFGIDIRPTMIKIHGLDVDALFGPDGAWRNVKGPADLRSRYITEEVPYGLVPSAQLARKAGIATPVMNGVIALISALCGEDYSKTGRTLQSLGLAELDREQIIELVRKG